MLGKSLDTGSDVHVAHGEYTCMTSLLAQTRNVVTMNTLISSPWPDDAKGADNEG